MEKKDFIGTELVAQSGTAEFDPRHTSINLWLKERIQYILASEYAKQVRVFTPADFALDIQESWPYSLPSYFLWCPFSENQLAPTGGLLFFKEDGFSEAEIKMLRWLLASYQYTWTILIKPKTVDRWQILKRKPYFITMVLVVLGILLFPIRLSVIGNGTVIAKEPALINAPMQGIIKSFTVTPGSFVKKDQVLINLDNTDLLAEANVDQRDYSLTQAKLRTSINEAFDDQNKRSEIPVLQAQLAIDKAKLDYTNTLLEKLM